jgi:type II secretory pathway component PulM
MTHYELKALLPLAALEQLDPQEADALREHLRTGCVECDLELREFEHAVAMLALAGETQASTTASAAEDHVAKKLDARLASPAAATTEAAAEVPSQVAIEEPPRRKGVSKISFGFAMAAALLLALYSAGVTQRLVAVQQEYQDQLAALESRFATVQAQAKNAELKAAALLLKAPESGQLEKVLDAPDLRIARLAPVGPASQAHALVALSKVNGTAVIRVGGLPRAPEGKTYEMWWITRQKGPVPAGLFNVQDGQEVVAQIEPPPSGQRVMAGAVTLESASGAQKPSGEMYLKGPPERE